MARTAHIVCDLGFGDSGKGLSVDALCRRYNSDLVVKYTGGPQASHTVVLADGREHRFSQFGSGTFLPNCRTYIGPEVLVEPFAMMNEAKALSGIGVTDAMDRMTVHPECVLVTPWHWLANQIRELSRGDSRHGSCGMGIGETKAMIERDATCIRVSNLGRPAHGLLKRIRESALKSLPIALPGSCAALYRNMLDENVDDLMDFYNDWARRVTISHLPPMSDHIVFEGAQGVLLDENHGFAPYNTWSDTTFRHALTICHERFLQPVKLGVLRAYLTRHGAGPFVTEDAGITWPDHNAEDRWQGNFRQGHFDMVMARYAIEKAGGVDGLILTHMDRSDDWKYCYGYDRNPEFTATGLAPCRPVIVQGREPIPTVESELGVDVKWASWSPSAEYFREMS